MIKELFVLAFVVISWENELAGLGKHFNVKFLNFLLVSGIRRLHFIPFRLFALRALLSLETLNLNYI